MSTVDKNAQRKAGFAVFGGIFGVFALFFLMVNFPEFSTVAFLVAMGLGFAYYTYKQVYNHFEKENRRKGRG
jgi:hypothetical protein